MPTVITLFGLGALVAAVVFVRRRRVRAAARREHPELIGAALARAAEKCRERGSGEG